MPSIHSHRCTTGMCLSKVKHVKREEKDGKKTSPMAQDGPSLGRPFVNPRSGNACIYSHPPSLRLRSTSLNFGAHDSSSNMLWRRT
jgi:hypothetical protein